MLLQRFSLLIILFLPGTPAVADLADIPNYREYSAILSSSGQPSKEQLQDARADGFERVIYLAFSDHHTSIDHEDRIVKDLGMEFVNIPIAMEAPTPNDFYLFAGIMQAERGKKTLVHCQINLRASAFSFLYRVIYEDIPLDEAKGDMNSVWVPNEIWKEFILDVLRENDIDADCDACGW